MKTKRSNQSGSKKQYRAIEKVSIIREHLLENKAISDLCDEHKIHPSVYYRWQKQFFEQGDKAFAPNNEKQMVSQLKQEISLLETKLARKDEVIAEVMADYISLKKRLGGR